MLFLPFRPQPLNREQLHFALCVYQTTMVNSNVPRYSILGSELHRNYLFKFKFVLSSVRSNTHMIAPPVVRTDHKLVQFQLQQLYGEIVQLQSALNEITTMSQEKSNMYHISEPIIRRFSPKLVLLCSLSSTFH